MELEHRRLEAMKFYYTVKDIEEMTTQSVADVYPEGRWIVIVLENGIRIKIRSW